MMFSLFNEEYFIDLDAIEDYIHIPPTESVSGSTETPTISLVKYESIKLMLEVIMDPQEPIDETLGSKSGEIPIPFKIAFNTLLNKKIITKY